MYIPESNSEHLFDSRAVATLAPLWQPRGYVYRIHNLLAEAITSLELLPSSVMSAVIEVRKPQVHLVLELVLGIIEQVMVLAADVTHHRELLCRCGENSSLHFCQRSALDIIE